MKIEVYTDGACSKNGKSDALASWAFYFPQHKELSKSGKVPENESQTNQRGELMAISEAIKAAETFPYLETELKIYTDSKYSKDCLTTWVTAWIRNDWKTSQGGDVKHRDLIEDTVNRLSKFKSYGFVHVKAHTGGEDEQSRNNHIVDRMATEVLNPSEKIEIVSNTQEPIQDLPLKLMGPPIYENELITWCKNNLDKLDKDSLNSALITALSKTVKKNGFEMVKQRLHRSVLYRLKTDNGLINEGISIIKEE
jgi:ribonuclease HI